MDTPGDNGLWLTGPIPSPTVTSKIENKDTGTRSFLRKGIFMADIGPQMTAYRLKHYAFDLLALADLIEQMDAWNYVRMYLCLRSTVMYYDSRKQSSMAALRHCFFSIAVFLIIVTQASRATSARCPASDRNALLTFRSSLSEPYLGIFSSWTGDDCCSMWYGVSCDPTSGRVADISLRGESEDPILARAGRTSGLMMGVISPEICRLERLTTLILADWKQIAGPIPPCVTSLPFLRILDLVGNRLSGLIPRDIGRLTRLTVLNVADNNISGRIPASITGLSSLMHLDLSNNLISGPIPGDWGKLRMLSRALLARNRISGGIPESIGSMPRLADLDLASNQISGELPTNLGSMPVLSSLYLDSNRLTGPIPATLLASRGLGILNLSRNAIEGEIPDVFTTRSYYTALDLSHNRLKGKVPKTLVTAAYVGHLDLSHNHLCGPIPVGSPFDHLEAASFVYNDCLCGWPLPACKP